MSRNLLVALIALALIVLLMFFADPFGFFAEDLGEEERGSGSARDLREDPTLAGRPGATLPGGDPRMIDGDVVGALDLGLGTASLTGLVTGDGAPLYAARVHVVLPPPAGLRGVRTARNGTWEIGGLPAGAHEVRATHKEYYGRTTVVPEVADGASVEVETIDLQRRGPYKNGFVVKVTDEFGRPIPEAKVVATTLMWGLHLTLGPELSGTPGVLDRRAATDERGEARLLEMEPERYDVVAVAPGYRLAAQPSIVLPPGRVRHLNFRLQPGASISGTIVGPDDAPIAGAYVTGLHMPSFAIALAVVSADDGSFVLEGLRNGNYWLMSGHDDHGEGQVNPVASPSTGAKVRLSGAGTVKILVTHPDGTPITRYRVRPYKEEPFAYTYSPSFPVESETGEGTIQLAPGTYNVAILGESGDLEEAKNTMVKVDETTSVTVVLPVSHTVSGVVVDPEGQHLSRAEVYVRMGGMPGGPRREQYARADGDGAFRLTGLPADTVNLHVEHAGFATKVVELDLTSGAPDTSLTLRLSRGATIEGRVTRGEDNPIAGEQVNVFRSFFDPLTTSTDTSGRYRVEGLGGGTWTVSTGAFENQAGGVLRGGIELGEEGTVTVDLELGVVEGMNAVTGTVTRGGEGVADATVSVIDQRGFDSLVQVKTDSQGRFRAEGIQAGAVTVQVQTTEGARTTTAVTVPAEGDAPDVTVVIGAGSVRGRLLLLDGTPVSAAWIQVEETSGGGRGRVRAQITSDPEGFFQAAGLDPGTYQVRVNGSGHAGLLTDPFEIPAEGAVDLGTYRLPTGVTLQGRVVDDTGTPVEDATISLTDENGRPVFLFSLVTTGSDGRYGATGLEPGRYVLGFEARGYAPSGQPIDLGPEGATVDGVLSRGGAIVVEVKDAAGDPLRGLRLGVIDAAGNVVERTLSLVNIFQGEVGRSGEDGVARIPDLAPGTYTLTVRTAGWAPAGGASPTVQVLAGQTSSAVLVLQAE